MCHSRLVVGIGHNRSLLHLAAVTRDHGMGGIGRKAAKHGSRASRREEIKEGEEIEKNQTVGPSLLNQRNQQQSPRALKSLSGPLTELSVKQRETEREQETLRGSSLKLSLQPNATPTPALIPCSLAGLCGRALRRRCGCLCHLLMSTLFTVPLTLSAHRLSGC